MQLLPFFFRNIAIVQKKQYNGCLVGYFHRLEYTYTLPQKKRNFMKVEFLLEKIVDQWSCGKFSFW